MLWLWKEKRVNKLETLFALKQKCFDNFQCRIFDWTILSYRYFLYLNRRRLEWSYFKPLILIWTIAPFALLVTSHFTLSFFVSFNHCFENLNKTSSLISEELFNPRFFLQPCLVFATAINFLWIEKLQELKTW